MRPSFTLVGLTAGAAVLALSAGCAAVDSARSQIGLPRPASAAANEASAPDSLSDRIGYPRFLAPPPGLALGCVERARHPITPGDWYGDDMLFGMTPQQVVQLLGPPAQQHYGKAPGAVSRSWGQRHPTPIPFCSKCSIPVRGA